MKLVLICVWFVMSTFTWAASVDQFPQDLIYKDKPIDPLCFFDVSETTEIVNLKKCGIQSFRKKHLIQHENETLSRKGFIGYNYSWKLNETFIIGGYSFYKAFGKTGSSVILQTMNNSGGTGSLSFLTLVKREGDKLNVSLLDGGDRCNGALEHVKRVQKKGHDYLVYSVHLTPYDYLRLANDNPHHLKAYDDLSACAACCAGKAVYQREIGSNFSNKKLLYVDARTYLKDINNASFSQPYQTCFNKVLEKHGAIDHGKLNARQLLLFTNQFNKECVQSS